ncbi:glycosyltransferase family 1 protein [Aerosakkonema funiforme]|uniref:Glycosyltransferase family 1 protein n=1 Tax=Aerosakkonema funiforme FACHB-1375 TaxID=2949571 RepID=A0A926VFX0_9CYAN|nr:glycosyltransferase family 1 protein [Aerosakkonema funiforme]MBD2183145.1 glycosyltransferase family 1 protein [Aerosakkonema funiforme FACHB-1375]
MSQLGNASKNNGNGVTGKETDISNSNSGLFAAVSIEALLTNLNLDAPKASFANKADLICLSHLRWDFVYQRPQHLLSRCAKERRVFIIEEPIFSSDSSARLDISSRESGVCVVVPHLKEGLSEDAIETALKEMLAHLFAQAQIREYIFWYYTPMALGFTRHLNPLAIVYDCMDELSAFKGANPILKVREDELFRRADIVFTGGQTLYEAKRDRHPNIYAFPSSIDRTHFAKARNITQEPADQIDIPHPRLGFFGVIDERMDIELLDGIAQACPDWHLVILGPVVKIDPAVLPQYANIHYLGGKSYQELPTYIAGWDVAMLPFARNESTRFISPTKTPEYLAAGKPVVSTSIRDVVRPYGENGLVEIADTVADFVDAIRRVIARNPQESGWLDRVDTFLSQTSWDSTWGRMMQLIEETISTANVTENSSINTAVKQSQNTAVEQRR